MEQSSTDILVSPDPRQQQYLLPHQLQQHQHHQQQQQQHQPQDYAQAQPHQQYPQHMSGHVSVMMPPSVLQDDFVAPKNVLKHTRTSSNVDTAYLTTFNDPIAEAYIADQALDEPFYSLPPPGMAYLDDGTLVPISADSSNLQTSSADAPYALHSGTHQPASIGPAQLSRFQEFTDDGSFDLFDDFGQSDDAVFSKDLYDAVPSSSAHITDSSANQGPSNTKEGRVPRRRTRRRQNISCDQCRASKRGCDFQLRLDADGNDTTKTNAAVSTDADADVNSTSMDAHFPPALTATVSSLQTDLPGGGGKRKLSDAGQINSAVGIAGKKLVCSNCQRRGIECTTNFADSVRNSKQAAQVIKDDLPSDQVLSPVLSTGTSKKRALENSDDGVRGVSMSSSDTGSPSNNSGTSESRARLIRNFQNRTDSSALAATGPNARFTQRADSLLLTTNRMRLYVHTVEPNANLWLSRACSPLRTDGDLGAYIKSAIGMDALGLSQELWASWHVDSPSSKREHQPNLFYLVYGLDHLGGEMGVWGEKPQPVASMPKGSASNPSAALDAVSSEFYQGLAEITGRAPGGWRRSKRDLMIDEAVKATMLAYACQFRLDDESTSSSANAISRKALDGKLYRDAHDRIATAAWKRARSLILQLAPRRSCRVAYGLFLFGVTAPPPGALAEGGVTSGADAAEDAAFAFETASRHLEWFVKRCRNLVRTVDLASKNPLLSENAEVLKQRRIAGDLMGLAESLGWFGLLIDTVAHVSQGRNSNMREDSLVDQSSGIGSGTGPGLNHGSVPASGLASSPPDLSTEALFALQDTINLLPARQAPPGAFPGTSESYMHEESEVDGSFQVDTVMSQRIMERAACARDLIPALLRNPGALANAIPFDVLVGGDPDAPGGTGGALLNINSPGGGLNEQVVLLGVAWGTAVEVYIWRRVGVLHAAARPLLASTNAMEAFVKGGGAFVTDRMEKLVMNILDAVRLFHSIFDSLISRALDEFAHLSRQARTMLSFFVIHIHLGVLHFVRLAKKMEQKELDFVQAFEAAQASTTNQSPSGQTPDGGMSSASSTGSPSTKSTQRPPLRSKMLESSVERRIGGRAAALGMARVAALVNAESAQLETASRLGRMGPKASPTDGKARKGSFYDPASAGIGGISNPNPIEDSANAPWRHPYPVMVADALKLSAQQLHDEVWDQLIAVPRKEAELTLLMNNFGVLLEGFSRLLHAVPGLGVYQQTLDDLENARDTANFVASQH